MEQNFNKWRKNVQTYRNNEAPIREINTTGLKGKKLEEIDDQFDKEFEKELEVFRPWIAEKVADIQKTYPDIQEKDFKESFTMSLHGALTQRYRDIKQNKDKEKLSNLFNPEQKTEILSGVFHNFIMGLRTAIREHLTDKQALEYARYTYAFKNPQLLSELIKTYPEIKPSDIKYLVSQNPLHPEESVLRYKKNISELTEKYPTINPSTIRHICLKYENPEKSITTVIQNIEKLSTEFLEIPHSILEKICSDHIGNAHIAIKKHEEKVQQLIQLFKNHQSIHRWMIDEAVAHFPNPEQELRKRLD